MKSKINMLFEPIQLGSLTLKNRIVKSAIWSRTASVDGEVTQQALDMYENFAKGGVSMVIVEAIAVDGRHTWEQPQFRIDDVKYLPGLRRLVEVIHLNGAACTFQLHCAGAFGIDPISPSGVPCYASARTYIVEPRTMSFSEIEEMRELFIGGAVRARSIGCDGVVVHASTSYLLQQFNSPHTNRRIDRYGGSLEGRIQLPLEIIRGIRKKCGSSFVIGCSITANELQPDGIIMEDAISFVKILEQEGVNHIDYSIGTYETQSSEGGRGASYRQPKGAFDYGEVFKKEVHNLRIFARCWGEQDPVKWEEALQRGQCDVIMAGRSLLSDPELPRKVAENRLDDIRLCTRCGMCVEYGIIQNYQVACTQNPELGREREYAIKYSMGNTKKVVIIGGGPGGLEAARVAALRGHDVTLIEKGNRLGGNVAIASIRPGKEELQSYFIVWLGLQCKKAGVKIELNKEATPAMIEKLKPDILIVAIGAVPMTPSIIGIERPNVFVAADVLMEKSIVKGKVIIIGGGQVGVETADYIVEKGMSENVTIIEMLSQIGIDMTAKNRDYIVGTILPRDNIKIFTNMCAFEIKDRMVLAMDREWQTHQFDADSIVNAIGYMARDTSSFDTLRGKISEVYKIGDCVEPRRILDTVHEAAYIARQF